MTSSTIAAGLVVFLLFSIWRTAGSRPALFVAVAVVVAAAVDVIWSQIATRRVEVKVLANPAEAYVGDPVTVQLELSGPRQTLQVRVDVIGAPPATPVDLPARRPATWVAPTRQLLTDLRVEVTGFGLAGLMAAQRWHEVPLARPLAVGPRPIPSVEPLRELPRGWGDGDPYPAHTGDIVRGVRPYVPGDPMRWVHWRAAARAGDLVIKEVEDIGVPRLVISLDLGNGGDGGERAAGRAAWYATEGIRRGYDVVLATVELDLEGDHRATRRTVMEPVGTPSDVIRRLATASPPGQPDLPDEQRATGVLYVTDEGDRWLRSGHAGRWR